MFLYVKNGQNSSSVSDIQIWAQIVTLNREGYSECGISVQMTCSKSLVHNTVVKF